jgi:hypothetical protein
MVTQTPLPSAAANPSGQTSAPSLPQLSDEWATSRDLIAKLDERIHDTRKLVFGLFSALLTAGSFFGLKTGDTNIPRAAWVAVHLGLLGLLLAGRFIERQALHLQAVAASRAWILELLTPVELTGAFSDLAPSLYRETKLIYVALGGVSAFVATLGAYSTCDGQKLFLILLVLGSTLGCAVIVLWWFPWDERVIAGWRSARENSLLRVVIFVGSILVFGVTVFRWVPRLGGNLTWVDHLAAFWHLDRKILVLALPLLGPTLVYVFIVFWLEPGDLDFTREGQDWSFDATSCRMNETISILLVNKSNTDSKVAEPAARLIHLFDESGKPVPKSGSGSSGQDKGGDVLAVPKVLLRNGCLPKRRACRWIWTPQEAGVWALEVTPTDKEKKQIRKEAEHGKGEKRLLASRIIRVDKISTPPNADCREPAPNDRLAR